MGLLTKENAQKIADKIMEIVPYNINIMDKNGSIIASGDKTRLNTVHKGAIKALEMKEAYNVYEDTNTERKGINLPIFYNYEIEGVIGISGDVDEVMQIGQIVVTIAQLMIENTVYNDISAIRESRLNDFFYEWSQRRREDYTEKFLSQAEYFHIDLKKNRVAVYIYVKRVRYSVIEQLKMMLGEEDYIIRQSLDGIMILFPAEKRLDKKITAIMDISTDLDKCYIGEPYDIASKTVQTAEKTRRMAEMLQKKERIIRYTDLQLECLLSDIEINHTLEEIMKNLQLKDGDDNLKNTILVYAQMNNESKAVCEALFIHRNTLNYRLEKIWDITGLNPRNGKDLMLLYILALKWKNKSEQIDR